MSSLKRLKSRHKMSTLKSLSYELFIRLYEFKYFREIVKPLFNSRKPIGWVFATGSYNSGTTIIKDLIALHPDVSTLPIEGDALTSGLLNFENGGWARCMYGNQTAIRFSRTRSTLCQSDIQRDWSPWIEEDKILLDKSISHSVRVSSLRKAFPGARFVIVTRLAPAVTKGIQRRSAPTGEALQLIGSSVYPEDILSKQWSFIYSCLVEDWKDDDCVLVSYEQFLNDPVSSAENVFLKLGLARCAVTLNNGTLNVAGRSLEVRNSGAQAPSGLTSISSLTAAAMLK